VRLRIRRVKFLAGRCRCVKLPLKLTRQRVMQECSKFPQKLARSTARWRSLRLKVKVKVKEKII
jgi:hypothetical protein